ncbi:MAG: 50S ribosomal protein L25/general stress protein Ctc [Gammaproteobacteria bacterium]|nr:50S ribosomal protein L25/general stress protein Ctc [Gammaproteobacteria bacterium]
MISFDISAERRVDTGKGASRRLRHAGKVPAILYGAGKEPANIQLEHVDLLHKSEQEAFYSHVLTLHLDGATQRVVLKDMQRHPFRPLITHVDLQRVAEDAMLTMRVPIHFLNEDKCVGVKLGGGAISHQMNDVEVLCLPKDRPEYIAIDLTDMKLGDTVHLGEITPPAGVQFASLVHGGDPMQPIVSVQAARVSEAADSAAEGAAPAAPAA